LITLRFDQLVNTTGGRLLNTGYGQRVFTGVSIDSRTLAKEQLFVAVRGERHDGHDFVDQAAQKGASGILVDTGYAGGHTLPGETPVVEVTDTHEAMLRMAREYLDTVAPRKAGITGSNGKTTTKEFAAQLLSVVEKQVYRSPGNFNNLFGIPLALFAMPEDTAVAVLEMGISVPGEMVRLASIVRPHLIAVTNVSATHLESLGTVEAVAREKLSSVQEMAPDAPLIINGDDPVLVEAAAAVRDNCVTFGIDRKAAYMPDRVERDDAGAMLVTIEGNRFRVPVFGRYQVYNLLAAFAIFKTMGYSLDGVDTESIQLSTAPMRGEEIISREVTFVADCYNANPDSVKAGLQSFSGHSEGRRRLVILGDMLELGEEAERYHIEIGRLVAEYKLDLAILVGPLSAHTADAAIEAGMRGDRVWHYSTADICASEMREFLQSGDLVYLKGSRGIGLEKILTVWQSEEEGA
jgi:UDP-N-acetylmuramoyl-tripeptide--D-alanyl-D-alanine ligase